MNKSAILAMTALASLATNLSALTVSSDDFCSCGRIPARFTAEGRDINPQLEIGDIPPNTKSLALIMDDPDAPGGTFTHWLLWNIPPGTTRIPSDSIPAGAITGTNDFGTTTYRGPKPPSGTHKYVFHIHALDTTLSLPAGADRKALDAAMKDHILATGSLQGTFSKEKK